MSGMAAGLGWPCACSRRHRTLYTGRAVSPTAPDDGRNSRDRQGLVDLEDTVPKNRLICTKRDKIFSDNTVGHERVGRLDGLDGANIDNIVHSQE